MVPHGPLREPREGRDPPRQGLAQTQFGVRGFVPSANVGERKNYVSLRPVGHGLQGLRLPRRLRCRLEFRWPSIIAFGQRAAFSASIQIGAGFCSAPDDLLGLAARNAIAIFFALSPIGSLDRDCLGLRLCSQCLGDRIEPDLTQRPFSAGRRGK